jgi:dipeptidyl aminopeptidase/acylaminoacyl peptidase
VERGSIVLAGQSWPGSVTHVAGTFCKGSLRTVHQDNLEPRVGVEPTTCRLRIGCSTTELPRPCFHDSIRGKSLSIQLHKQCAESRLTRKTEKGLFVSAPTRRGSVLLHLDLQGRTNVLWEQPVDNVTYARPSPDGRHIAMIGWTLHSNVWMMENF